MKRGKKICKTLKEVRMQVARANDIEYAPTECHHEGDCTGTCPKCEAEVQYLERQLNLRRQLGKAVAVVGVSMGLAAITACKTHKSTPIELAGDVEPNPPITAETDGYVPRVQTDTFVIDTVPVAEKPTDAIIGDNSEIPDTVDPPTYPGGKAALSQFLNENIKYPKEAEKAKIEGRVLVGFIVDVDGAISEARIEHSSHPLLDREALRVIRLMPAWNPAKEKASGKPLKVMYHLPVNFKL
ncbi:MAG: energy transducer TonB [Prevotella sp.]|nr:energy transducer TonB [Prevotella sp.]MBO4658636.1 energy transducer TonB [Prevotella sp.]